MKGNVRNINIPVCDKCQCDGHKNNPLHECSSACEVKLIKALEDKVDKNWEYCFKHLEGLAKRMNEVERQLNLRNREEDTVIVDIRMKFNQIYEAHNEFKKSFNEYESYFKTAKFKRVLDGIDKLEQEYIKKSAKLIGDILSKT